MRKVICPYCFLEFGIEDKHYICPRKVPITRCGKSKNNKKGSGLPKLLKKISRGKTQVYDIFYNWIQSKQDGYTFTIEDILLETELKGKEPLDGNDVLCLLSCQGYIKKIKHVAERISSNKIDGRRHIFQKTLNGEICEHMLITDGKTKTGVIFKDFECVCPTNSFQEVNVLDRRS